MKRNNKALSDKVKKAHQHDIIVIGASMGGLSALRQLISEFPADFQASVFVLLHISAEHKSYLAEILGRYANLPVVSAKDLDLIKPGHVYVAVPDFHLLLERTHIRLGHGPKENLHRPSIDTLFSSAAKVFGSKVIGVVLTGALDDGTSGLMDIKRYGGTAVVQDPSDAENPSMPASALNCVPVDHCAPLSEIGSLLMKLVDERVGISKSKSKERIPVPSEPELSNHICPQCNGPLWFVKTGKLLHFHCRIGHGFSGQSLLVEKTNALESALWSAVNALKDKANIANRLAKHAGNNKFLDNSRFYHEQASNAEKYARLITEILLQQNSPAALSHKKRVSTHSKKKMKIKTTPKNENLLHA